MNNKSCDLIASVDRKGLFPVNIMLEKIFSEYINQAIVVSWVPERPTVPLSTKGQK